jgi:4-hydroxybenzoate polyprenyltransferase
MYGCRYFILATNSFQKVNDVPLAFGLLVLSTILIAAGGNVINDYFDIKADRVNKPEKLIVGRLINKRKAILFHWILNGFAFLLGIGLSIYFKSASIVFIQLISINLLWFYSLHFKRKVFVGNFVVAVLTGMIPMLVIIYFEVLNNFGSPFTPFNEQTWSNILNYNYIYVLAIMAFIQNFAREIVKDMEDVDGDRLLHAKTIPMALGFARTKVLVSGILFFTPLIYFFFIIDNQLASFGLTFWTSIGWMIASLLDLAGIALFTFSSKDQLKRNQLLIKISMLFGVLTTFQVYLNYLMYGN